MNFNGMQTARGHENDRTKLFGTRAVSDKTSDFGRENSLDKRMRTRKKDGTN